MNKLPQHRSRRVGSRHRMVISRGVMGAGIVYTTLDSANKAAVHILSGGDLTLTHDGTNAWGTTYGVHAKTGSGKWYWESYYNATGSLGGTMPGVAGATSPGPTQTNTYPGFLTTGYGINNTGGPIFQKWNAASATSLGVTGASTGDWIGVALDLDAATITFYKNGTVISGSPHYSSINTALYWKPAAGLFTANQAITVNFGPPWNYDPPAGFSGWTTA